MHLDIPNASLSNLQLQPVNFGSKSFGECVSGLDGFLQFEHFILQSPNYAAENNEVTTAPIAK